MNIKAQALFDDTAITGARAFGGPDVTSLSLIHISNRFALSYASPSFFKQVISIIPLLFHSENRQNKISANKKIPTQFITDAGICIELHIDILFSEIILWTRCLFNLALEGGGRVSFLLDVLSGILANIISGKILMISKKHSQKKQ